MSATLTNYDFKFDWAFTGTCLQNRTDDEIKADAIEGMNTVAVQQFNLKMAPTGHIYRVNNITTTISKFVRHALLPFAIDFAGSSTLNFDCDVSDPYAHNSPQLIEILLAILGAILTAIVMHPLAFLLIIAIVAFVIGAVVLMKVGTGVIIDLGNKPGSFILGLGILVVVGLGIYALFFTKGGRKAGRKGYQVARHGYRAARRRS